MSKRYIQWGYDSFKDTKTGEIIDDHIHLLNQQDQRIAELEEQLKNSRVKFFIGFDGDFNVAVKELDLNIVLPNWMYDKEFKFYDTKEEAQAKLEELTAKNV